VVQRLVEARPGDTDDAARRPRWRADPGLRCAAVGRDLDLEPDVVAAAVGVVDPGAEGRRDAGQKVDAAARVAI
jgi:hypothetical protein